MGTTCSRMGLRRLTFEPYTHMQLMEIVTSRLANLPVFKVSSSSCAPNT